MELKITKNEDGVSISIPNGADLHEVIGLLATSMNYVIIKAQTEYAKEL
jgi:hypothetical protein